MPCPHLQERNSGQSTIDYPMGGSASIVSALIRGIEKHGGQVLTRAHVDQIHMEGDSAAVALGHLLVGGAVSFELQQSPSGQCGTSLLGAGAVREAGAVSRVWCGCGVPDLQSACPWKRCAPCRSFRLQMVPLNFQLVTPCDVHAAAGARAVPAILHPAPHLQQ